MVTLDMAERIRGMRTARGYTQERLARQLGLTPAAVSKWECGQALPDITVLGPLAAALGTTTDDLLGYDPDVDGARAEEVLGPVREAASRGDAAEAEKLAGEALAAYPASTTVAFAAASALMEAAQAAADPGEAGRAMARSVGLFERCRQEGSAEQREAAAFVLAGQYVLKGDHARALEAARSIPVPQADPRLMEAAALAASGDLDAAEGLARGALAEKEADAERLRDVLGGIARRRAER